MPTRSDSLANIAENTATGPSTTLKQAQDIESELAALRAENQLLHRTLAAITDSIIVFNAEDYKTLVANPAASQGRNVRGLPCYKLNHQRDTPCGGAEHSCPVEILRNSKHPVTVEHIHHREGGESHILEISAFPILNDEGELTHVVEVAKDVTERRRTEEYHERMQESLEHLHDTVHTLSMCRSNEEIADVVLETASYLLDQPFSCIIHILPKVGSEGALVGKTDGEVHQVPSVLFDSALAERTMESCQTHILTAQDQIPSPWRAVPDFNVGVSASIHNLGCFQAILTGQENFAPDHMRLLSMLLTHAEEALNRLARQTDLETKALHDSLTGAFNRHYLDVVLEREVKRAERYGNQIAIMMVDINNFKRINDQFGHLQGDTILSTIAREILGQVRETDFVFRYGGDEFLVLMPQSENPAESVSARIHARISTLNAEQGFGLGEHPVTISTGISYWTPANPWPIETALEEADREMYRNKQREA